MIAARWARHRARSCPEDILSISMGYTPATSMCSMRWKRWMRWIYVVRVLTRYVVLPSALPSWDRIGHLVQAMSVAWFTKDNTRHYPPLNPSCRHIWYRAKPRDTVMRFRMIPFRIIPFRIMPNRNLFSFVIRAGVLVHILWQLLLN